MELARLLHYPTISAALADTAGLPIQDGAVRFKGGPQPLAPFQPPSHLRAMVDSIVLSTMQNDPHDHPSSSDTITNNNANTANTANNDNPLRLRVTSDGILLPSEEWMRRMLLLLL